jgi:hypothetical protein
MGFQKEADYLDKIIKESMGIRNPNKKMMLYEDDPNYHKTEIELREDPDESPFDEWYDSPGEEGQSGPIKIDLSENISRVPKAMPIEELEEPVREIGYPEYLRSKPGESSFESLLTYFPDHPDPDSITIKDMTSKDFMARWFVPNPFDRRSR